MSRRAPSRTFLAGSYTVVAAAALLLSGCVLGMDGQAPADSTSGSPAAAVGGLRGWEKGTVAGCPADYESAPRPGPGPAAEVIGEPIEIIVCSWKADNFGRTVPVGPVLVGTGTQGFAPLLSALSAPSQTPTDGPCTTQFEYRPLLYARTAAGTWRVQVPVDSCGFSQAPLAEAVESVTAG